MVSRADQAPRPSQSPSVAPPGTANRVERPASTSEQLVPRPGDGASYNRNIGTHPLPLGSRARLPLTSVLSAESATPHPAPEPLHRDWSPSIVAGSRRAEPDRPARLLDRVLGRLRPSVDQDSTPHRLPRSTPPIAPAASPHPIAARLHGLPVDRMAKETRSTQARSTQTLPTQTLPTQALSKQTLPVDRTSKPTTGATGFSQDLPSGPAIEPAPARRESPVKLRNLEPVDREASKPAALANAVTAATTVAAGGSRPVRAMPAPEARRLGIGRPLPVSRSAAVGSSRPAGQATPLPASRSTGAVDASAPSIATPLATAPSASVGPTQRPDSGIASAATPANASPAPVIQRLVEAARMTASPSTRVDPSPRVDRSAQVDRSPTQESSPAGSSRSSDVSSPRRSLRLELLDEFERKGTLCDL